MAHFYGTVQGGRGKASRCGHKSTGLTVVAEGWNGVVTVRLSRRIDPVTKTEVDWANVSLGVRTLYDGPLNNYRDPRGYQIPVFEPGYSQETKKE